MVPCFGEDVLNNLILGAGINLLEFSDRIVVEFVHDIIMIERATALPLQLGRLDGHFTLLHIPPKGI